MAQLTTASFGLDTTAYNLRAWMALRAALFADDLATVKTTPQTHQGAAVVFNNFVDLAPAITPLTETTDVTPAPLSDTQTTLTLTEYGNATESTAKVRFTSFLAFDPIIADIVGFNAGETQDTLAMNALVAGTNVTYGGTRTSRVTLAATDKITSSKVRYAYAKLAGASVQMFEDGYYRAIMHPDVAYDLKEETGDIGWRVVHNNSLPGDIVNGDIGAYEGFRFTVSPRAAMVADGGVSSTVDVYQSLFMGQQALAKGYSTGVHGDGQTMGPKPIIIVGDFTDNLKRFKKLGWYWFGAYGVFRQSAVLRLETASSIGANT